MRLSLQEYCAPIFGYEYFYVWTLLTQSSDLFPALMADIPLQMNHRQFLHAGFVDKLETASNGTVSWNKIFNTICFVNNNIAASSQVQCR